MAMLAEHYEFVIGGDPDRDTIDLAVLDTATGGVARSPRRSADGAGYGRMLDWAQPACARAAASGRWKALAASPPGWPLCWPRPARTSSRSAASSGRRGAKNDRIDAVRAARERPGTGAPGHAAGTRPAGGATDDLATRQAVLVSRTKAINELKSLIVVAPEHLRAGPARPPLPKQLDRIEAMPARGDAAVEHRDHRPDTAVDRRPHPVPARPDRRARPRTDPAGQDSTRPDPPYSPSPASGPSSPPSC